MPNTPTAYVFSADTFLAHWQGHRGLTRRVIEAFPEDALFNYSLGGMRPFAALALEMIGMARYGMEGVATGVWPEATAEGESQPTTKAALLRQWDEATAVIESWWPRIPPERFHQVDKAFGLYEGPMYWTLSYFLDNEVHHRGQGYVYLRSLGMEPPPFWDRK
jgi:uncharacterized damage-inducible protein DinB